MSRGFLAGLMAAAVALPAVALADANELTTTQTIRIKAPPETVWAVVGDFGGLAKWLPPIAESHLVLKSRNEEGAIRALLRANGTRVTEKLTEYDPYNMRLSYTYVDGQVAASDYFSTMTVTDAGNGESIVTWAARFKRVNYWQDPPPAGQDDAAMTAFYTKVYVGGLNALKKAIEDGGE